jgi:hypothetical protein
MKPRVTGTAARFLAGLVLGIVGGAVGIYLGLVSAFVAVVFVSLIGLAIGRSTGLSGGLVGIGGTWLLLMASDLMRCPAQSSDCGGGDALLTVVWLAVSAAIALVGGAIAVLSVSPTDRRKDDQEGGASGSV